MTTDLDERIAERTRAWRAGVDARRPEFDLAATPDASVRTVRAHPMRWVATGACAAGVCTLAVVLALSGAEHRGTPLPPQETGPGVPVPATSSCSYFADSIADGARGAATPELAVERFARSGGVWGMGSAPDNWSVVQASATQATFESGGSSLHVVRLAAGSGPNRGWFVDSGRTCLPVR